jgi:hypothetical protein
VEAEAPASPATSSTRRRAVGARLDERPRHGSLVMKILWGTDSPEDFEVRREIDSLRAALAHIANVQHWIDDDPNERVAYLQRCARDVLHAGR